MGKRLWDLPKSRFEIGTFLLAHRHKVPPPQAAARQAPTQSASETRRGERARTTRDGRTGALSKVIIIFNDFSGVRTPARSVTVWCKCAEVWVERRVEQRCHRLCAALALLYEASTARSALLLRRPARRLSFVGRPSARRLGLRGRRSSTHRRHMCQLPGRS